MFPQNAKMFLPRGKHNYLLSNCETASRMISGLLLRDAAKISIGDDDS